MYVNDTMSYMWMKQVYVHDMYMGVKGVCVYVVYWCGVILSSELSDCVVNTQASIQFVSVPFKLGGLTIDLSDYEYHILN